VGVATELSSKARITMGCLFRSFLLALFIGLPIGVTYLAIDKDPLVSRAGEINFQDLKRAETLARRYDPRRMPPERITTVRATAQELNTLLKGSMGALKFLSSRVDVNRFGVIAAVTLDIPVPKNPIGKFVNVRAVIAPSDKGLKISRFAVGDLEIPPVVIKPVLKFALNRLVGDGKGDPILDSVKSIKVTGPLVTLAFRPPANLMADIKSAAKRHISVSSPEKVRRYYEEIDRAMARTGGYGRTSLVSIMQPVFKLAKDQSRGGDPAAENEAAILAIAIYFGDVRFERFVGDVRPKNSSTRRRSTGNFRLDGRHDFVQHFTISMGLTITGGDLAANIIGELKEAKDAQKSSGFSFTDIGADRAGVQFAKRATESRSSAVQVQNLLAAASAEQVFFPRFSDLPEGMSEAAFRRRYGDVNSREYKRMIAEIDRRIARTQLFR
jgi:hypothetical protein